MIKFFASWDGSRVYRKDIQVLKTSVRLGLATVTGHHETKDRKVPHCRRSPSALTLISCENAANVGKEPKVTDAAS
jgi:hypothetical protein